jgi:origin recognition complex subunit 5
MKAHERKRRKKGGGTALGRPPKHRKIQRRLLGPQPFVLERMLAIFQSIVPHDGIACNADIMTQIATLASLRLVCKSVSSADSLDAGAKWRVNVGWEHVQALARSVRFDVESYLVE